MLTVQYSLYLTLEKHDVKKKKERNVCYLLFESEHGNYRRRAVFYRNGSHKVLFVTLQYIKTPFLQYFVDPRPQHF